ncbi:hypothetical protein [Candidatus Nitrosoglobus terrae]|uniref:hypothetical protein n=1 Tax=Candidatus Nitrosoglobus terrae TaxID=1630141 RepID=UPI001556DEAE|nr:hypothetical protein [Candidatus Nitrosoglobus terrae]
MNTGAVEWRKVRLEQHRHSKGDGREQASSNCKRSSPKRSHRHPSSLFRSPFMGISFSPAHPVIKV